MLMSCEAEADAEAADESDLYNNICDNRSTNASEPTDTRNVVRFINADGSVRDTEGNGAGVEADAEASVVALASASFPSCAFLFCVDGPNNDIGITFLI